MFKSFKLFILYRAIGHVMSSLFYPLITFLLLAIVIAYWAITAMYPSALLYLKFHYA